MPSNGERPLIGLSCAAAGAFVGQEGPTAARSAVLTPGLCCSWGKLNVRTTTVAIRVAPHLREGTYPMVSQCGSAPQTFPEIAETAFFVYGQRLVADGDGHSSTGPAPSLSVDSIRATTSTYPIFRTLTDQIVPFVKVLWQGSITYPFSRYCHTEEQEGGPIVSGVLPITSMAERKIGSAAVWSRYRHSVGTLGRIFPRNR